MNRHWFSPVILVTILVLLLSYFLTGCTSTSSFFQKTRPASSQTATPLPDDTIAAPAANPISVPAAEASQDIIEETPTAEPPRYAYLTFDDGPNTHYTEKVLDILALHQAKATFFVVGENIKRNPQIVKKILAQGHSIANHTYSHNFKKIYVSQWAFTKDLNKGAELISSFTGQPAGIYRAPGGPTQLSRAFRNKLAKQGYQSVSWNITGADSDPAGVTPEQVYKSVEQGLDKVEKLKLTPIILLHDGAQLYTTKAPPGSPVAKYIQNRESVIKALPQIIELLKSRGYTFGLIDKNTPDAWGQKQAS